MGYDTKVERAMELRNEPLATGIPGKSFLPYAFLWFIDKIENKKAFLSMKIKPVVYFMWTLLFLFLLISGILLQTI